MSRFHKFCEETTFNGLAHVSSAKSKVPASLLSREGVKGVCGQTAQAFWVTCFTGCCMTVICLFAITYLKYTSSPTGIDQLFVQGTSSLLPPT